MNRASSLRIIRKRTEQHAGFALLEYCAGAAILAGFIVAVISAFGGGVRDLSTNIADWARQRGSQIGQTPGG